MIRISEYELYNPKITKDIRIINIVDLHSEISTLFSLEKIIDKIKPDIIVLPGDIFDSIDHKNNQDIVNYLKNISEKYKIYISVGNHDLGIFLNSNKHINTNDYKYFYSLKISDNIYPFINNNEIYKYSNINIYGFNIPDEWYTIFKEDKDYFKILFNDYLNNINIDTNKFNILLLHSANGLIINDDLEFEINGINLILSGHNHGGLTPVFIQQLSNYRLGLFCPYKRFFKTGAYGFWNKGNTSLIMSSGAVKMGASHGIKPERDFVNKFLGVDIDYITLKNGYKHKLVLKKIIQHKK